MFCSTAVLCMWHSLCMLTASRSARLRLNKRVEHVRIRKLVLTGSRMAASQEAMSRPAKVAKPSEPEIEDLARQWLAIDYLPQTRKVVQDLLDAGDKPVDDPPSASRLCVIETARLANP